LRNLALILDMDGVIVNSNPVHREAWALYIRQFGVDAGDASPEWWYGRRNDEIVRDFFGSHLSAEEVRAHGAAKEQLYRKIIGPRLNDALVPGVREFLERHRGQPIGLATNAGPANVEFLLDGARLGAYFRAVVDGHQVKNPKPAPDIYLRAASLLGAEPQNCVVFEDSLPGIQAARAAGMALVGVKTTHAEFADVDLAIENFNSPELEPWLARR
jgi:beta-phosphoglucomutase